MLVTPRDPRFGDEGTGPESWGIAGEMTEDLLDSVGRNLAANDNRGRGLLLGNDVVLFQLFM